jgi:hypothetical protein
MITVKVKELSIIDSDVYKNLEKRTTNSFTKQHSQIIERDHKARFCKDHPDYENVITLIAVESDIPLLEKTDFCCRDFKDKMGITITKAS